MWINDIFQRPKPVIGMIHLDALPGSVRYDPAAGLKKVTEHARADFDSLREGGIDGVIFCNENDKPYSKNVGKEVVSAMTAVIDRIVGGDDSIPFGVDVQWDAAAALAIALTTGASFIRGIACGTFCGDLGFFSPNPEEIIKYRRMIGADHIRILTNLMPEFSYSLDLRPLPLVAQTVPKSALADGICISGVMASKAAPYEQLKAVKDVLPCFPVFANTGVDFGNIKEILGIADACVVATCLKQDCKSQNRINRDSVSKLMRLANEGRNA